MTFDQVLDFLENKMSMSHIYQPLLIKSLVETGGSATIRQLANDFLLQDESQLLYYEKKIKGMPLKVLKKHEIVDRDGDLVSINVKRLTFEQRAQIKMICEKKLQEFIVKRGLGIWDYRLLDSEPIPDSLRYVVLKESGGKCELCGATKNERPLDVDHIKPKSRGGKNVYENLQVLCSKCNRSKRNLDETDFRDNIAPEEKPGCAFCYEKVKPRIVEHLNYVYAIKDKYPVTSGHHIIIPRRHSQDYFSLTENEKKEADKLITILKRSISKKDKTVTGFNVGMNCGESAGQTIFHAHIHVIPRRNGDTPNPRGGVRGVIPEKMAY